MTYFCVVWDVKPVSIKVKKHMSRAFCVAAKLKNFIPRVKQTVTYIVCTVLLNDRGEILMIQEAKETCRGRWYLPAGRMERNETIEVCRECFFFYSFLPLTILVRVMVQNFYLAVKGIPHTFHHNASSKINSQGATASVLSHQM